MSKYLTIPNRIIPLSQIYLSNVYIYSFQLNTVGITEPSLHFNSVAMDFDKYICVRQPMKGDTRSEIVIIDTEDVSDVNIIRKPVMADSANMNPAGKLIALKGDLSLSQQLFFCFHDQ